MGSEGAAPNPLGWRRTGPWLAAAAAAVAVSVASPWLGLPPDVTNAIGNGLQLAAALAATVACLLRSRLHGGQERTGWLLLGLGAGSWAAGQLVWSWYEVVQGVAVPSPGLADLAYLLLYPLALAGLLFLAPLVTTGRLTRGGIVLDAVLSVLAVIVVAWPAFLHRQLHEAPTPAAGWVTVAYPLLDILLLGLAGGILLRRLAAWRSSLGMAYGAFWFILLADLGYSTQSFQGGYVTGQFLDAGWMAGFLVLAAAAHAPAPAPVEGLRPRYAQLVGHILPLVAVLLGVLGFLLAQSADQHGPVWQTLLALLLVTAMARQALAAFEHRADMQEREAVQADYKGLFGNMREGVAHCRMIYDGTTPVDFEYLSVNRSFEALTGLRHPVGRRVTELIPGIRAANPEIFAAYGRAAAGGPPEHFEVEVPGVARWFDITVYAARPGEFVAVFDNITERKETERALRRRERALTLISAVNEALIRADSEPRLLQDVCSIAAEKGGYRLAWVGFARDTPGHPVEPVAWAGPEAAYLKTLRVTWDEAPQGQVTGKCIRDQKTVVVRDIAHDVAYTPFRQQAVAHGFGSSIALFLPLGQERGTVGLYSARPDAFEPDEVSLLEEMAGDLAFGIRALRERKARHDADERVRRSEARLREAQRTAHVGSWELELSNNALSWSDENYRIFGVQPGAFEATYEFFLDTIHPDDREAVNKAYTTSVATRAPYNIEHRLVMKDGRIKWVHEHGETVYSADGKPLKSVGTTQDITERKQAEEDRRILEARNREVKRLEELNKMRMDFLNTAAHDLKTPLTPLKLQMATLRVKGNLDPTQKSALDLMDRNVNRFQVLVEDMLDAARLQAGKLQLRRASVALAPLVEEAIAAFQEPAKQGGLTFDVEPMPEVKVDADPAKSMQVLMNVVSNAVKYTPPGGRVQVRLHATPTEAVLSVRDSGLGMTAEQLGRLFQPFVRLHEDKAGVAKGTGLGLYISKGIIEQHGGHIWAESPGPGQGTTFFVAWPVAGKPPPATA